ncbi:MAG: hypothetical protein FRX49_13692 [Trebouxia sp. A1-2]|nr:MAG: hypothetical protein FRX49_13692 [Trebouxia sp. A1-2]
MSDPETARAEAMPRAMPLAMPPSGRIATISILGEGAAPFQEQRPCGQPTQNGRARVEFAGSNNNVFTQTTVPHIERKATTHSDRGRAKTYKFWPVCRTCHRRH